MVEDLNDLFEKCDYSPVELGVRIMKITGLRKEKFAKYPWKGIVFKNFSFVKIRYADQKIENFFKTLKRSEQMPEYYQKCKRWPIWWSRACCHQKPAYCNSYWGNFDTFDCDKDFFLKIFGYVFAKFHHFFSWIVTVMFVDCTVVGSLHIFRPKMRYTLTRSAWSTWWQLSWNKISTSTPNLEMSRDSPPNVTNLTLICPSSYFGYVLS